MMVPKDLGVGRSSWRQLWLAPLGISCFVKLVTSSGFPRNSVRPGVSYPCPPPWVTCHRLFTKISRLWPLVLYPIYFFIISSFSLTSLSYLFHFLSLLPSAGILKSFILFPIENYLEIKIGNDQEKTNFPWKPLWSENFRILIFDLNRKNNLKRKNHNT